MRVVIIGGGSAGVSAATHLRRQDENAEIIIIEKSDEFAVASCGLPDLVAGKIKDKDELVGATPEQMKHIFQIDVRLNTEVLIIEPELKLLNLSGGQKLEYDRLIIAAGSLQLRPDIDGILADNIFTLHNLYSAQKIIDYFWGLNVKKVVVLGASSIGLSTAQALIENGAKVTLIDKASHILSHVDHDFGLLAQQKIKHPNLTILTNTTVKAFLADKAVLSNGRKIACEMAVVAAGSRSEVRLPIMADIEIGETGGIIVDKYMHTSVDDIWACGDNIELKDLITLLPTRPETANTAILSAKIAADNTVDIKTQMDGLINTEVVKIFGLIIAACGCNENELKQAKIAYHKLYLAINDCETYTNLAEKMFMKLLFGVDGKILGFQALGKNGVYARLNVVTAFMMQQGTVYEMAKMPMGYYPALSRAKDAINILGSLAAEITSERLQIADIDDLDDNDVLLDVCNAAVFRQKYKHQAINIPLADLRQNLTDIPKGKKIVVTCNGGYAAYLAYRILVQRGFNRVFWLNSPEVWL